MCQFVAAPCTMKSSLDTNVAHMAHLLSSQVLEESHLLWDKQKGLRAKGTCSRESGLSVRRMEYGGGTHV